MPALLKAMSNAAVGSHAGLHEGAHIRLLPHVGTMVSHRGAGFPNALGDRLPEIPSASAEKDPRPFRGEGACGGSPDAGSGSGDQNHLVAVAFSVGPFPGPILGQLRGAEGAPCGSRGQGGHGARDDASPSKIRPSSEPVVSFPVSMFQISSKEVHSKSVILK